MCMWVIKHSSKVLLCCFGALICSSLEINCLMHEWMVEVRIVSLTDVVSVTHSNIKLAVGSCTTYPTSCLKPVVASQDWGDFTWENVGVCLKVKQGFEESSWRDFIRLLTPQWGEQLQATLASISTAQSNHCPHCQHSRCPGAWQGREIHGIKRNFPLVPLHQFFLIFIDLYWSFHFESCVERSSMILTIWTLLLSKMFPREIFWIQPGMIQPWCSPWVHTTLLRVHRNYAAK